MNVSEGAETEAPGATSSGSGAALHATAGTQNEPAKGRVRIEGGAAKIDGLNPNLSLQIWIGRHEHSCLAGIDVGRLG